MFCCVATFRYAGRERSCAVFVNNKGLLDLCQCASGFLNNSFCQTCSEQTVRQRQESVFFHRESRLFFLQILGRILSIQSPHSQRLAFRKAATMARRPLSFAWRGHPNMCGCSVKVDPIVLVCFGLKGPSWTLPLLVASCY